MNLEKIKFPLNNYEKLIKDISGLKLVEWINFWEKKENILSYAAQYYGGNYRDDWLWGVILPILYDIFTLIKKTAGLLLVK